ncbi:hypothetical protein HOB10_05085 [Candidatus Parcubacteria bacterium]|jgi:hypothetical protein|nr:hypothetical protein [Candidatus Parcubacteria bacterium]
MKKIIFILSILFFASSLLLNINKTQAAGGPCVDFFYGIGCSHCEAVKPFITQLANDNPTWQINWYEVYEDQNNADLLNQMFAKHAITRGGVPIVFVGDTYIIGDTPIKRGLEEAVGSLSVYACPATSLDKIPASKSSVPTPTPVKRGANEEAQPELFGSLEQSEDLIQQQSVDAAGDSKLPQGIVVYVVFGLLVIMLAVFIIKNRT